MIQVAVIGVGLIGGSLGMALRQVRIDGKRIFHVIGFNRSKKNNTLCLKRGAVDKISKQLRDGISLADVIVLAMPVDQIEPIMKKIVPWLKPGSITMDVGSVKSSIIKRSHIYFDKRPDLAFVGCHPMAGSEKTGVAHASADLFKDATTIICNEKKKSKALDLVKKIWQSVGSQVVFMGAEKHDELTAFTSHLPHLMSFSLFSVVNKIAKKNPLIKKLAAGSFRDMTRIAGSSATIWTSIFNQNKKNLLTASSLLHRQINKITHMPSHQITKEIQKINLQKKKWIHN
ncbi:MAG: prephenate dehydrogenase [Elusimicrobiota bacterium]